MKQEQGIRLFVAVICLLAVMTTLSPRPASQLIGPPQGPPQLVRLFPEGETASAESAFQSCIYASPVVVESRGETFILVASYETLAAVHPKTGQVVWTLRPPLPAGQAPFIVATPVQVENKLIVAYQVRSTTTWQRVSHRVAVVDLDQRTFDKDFPIIELVAEKSVSDGSGLVRFNPKTSLSHSVVHARPRNKALGYAYVSFGSAGDIQPWHGWVFEIALDAWRKKGANAAISAVLLTTPETVVSDHRGSRSARRG